MRQKATAVRSKAQLLGADRSSAVHIAQRRPEIHHAAAVEGQADHDIVVFNGSGAGEIFAFSANGTRLFFTRG